MKKQPVFRFTFILILFAVFSNTYSQEKTNGSFGIRCGVSLSASRLGSMVTPSVSYKWGKHLLSAGISLQQSALNVAGAKLNYEYTLFDPQKAPEAYVEWLGLYSFVNAGYFSRATLGKNACAEERSSNKELVSNPETLRLRGYEIYAGFGVRITVCRNLQWYNAIGAGGYMTMNTPDDLYYESKSPGLQIRTGLSYTFARRTKGSF